MRERPLPGGPAVFGSAMWWTRGGSSSGFESKLVSRVGPGPATKNDRPVRSATERNPAKFHRTPSGECFHRLNLPSSSVPRLPRSHGECGRAKYTGRPVAVTSLCRAISAPRSHVSDRLTDAGGLTPARWRRFSRVRHPPSNASQPEQLCVVGPGCSPATGAVRSQPCRAALANCLSWSGPHDSWPHRRPASAAGASPRLRGGWCGLGDRVCQDELAEQGGHRVLAFQRDAVPDVGDDVEQGSGNSLGYRPSAFGGGARGRPRRRSAGSAR
ncbi:hypothetical protein SAMN04489729_7098 [Amycolatopsis lurida]|nr:hypothetical protein SAMN04489729_7098 [Amycolatopsis lurida]